MLRRPWSTSSTPREISRRPHPCAGILSRCCWGVAWRRCSTGPLSLPGCSRDRAYADLARRQRGARRCARLAASQPGGLPARASPADGYACRLRAWGLRRVHGARERRYRSVLSDARGANRRRYRGDHRRTIRQRRDRRSAGCLSRSQCAAMRLLYARNTDGRARLAKAMYGAGPRADPRASIRQLLPLHRLPGHHRCGRDHGAPPSGSQSVTDALENSAALSALDRPNSYIGKTVPRPNLERLMQGRGLYVSDVELPRMAHVVFLRSPHAHAEIIAIDVSAAKRIPGVIAVVTDKELAAVITPGLGVLSHLKGPKSAPQHAIAMDHVCWQGEAVAAIVATSRAVAEDAAEIVAVEYRELEAVTEMRTALDRQTLVIHPSLGDNLAFERNLDAGAVDQVLADSEEVIEADLVFGRLTGVALERRSGVADWNVTEARLTIYQGT